MVLAILSSVTERPVLNINSSDKSRFRSSGYIPSQNRLGHRMVDADRKLSWANPHCVATDRVVSRDRVFFRLIYSQIKLKYS